MPSFASPVTLTQFQTYLKDSSVDPVVTGFFLQLLDTATEYVYRWLDRDFTASAIRTDVFWGDGQSFYRPRHPVGSLLSWTTISRDGTTSSIGVGDLILRENGNLVLTKTGSFEQGLEHRLMYQLPGGLSCPETVQHVILEIAALMYDASKQGGDALGLIVNTDRNSAGTDRERYADLTERHKELLRPYKRIPV